MKKFIYFYVLLILTCISLNVSAAHDYTATYKHYNEQLIYVDTYVGGHSEFKKANVVYEKSSQVEGYSTEATISFECNPYCEYVLLMSDDYSIGFYNEEFGEEDYNLHYNYEYVDNVEFCINNKTATFPSEDNYTYLMTLSSDSTADWAKFLGVSGEYVSFENKNYSISNGIVVQSQNVTEVSLPALCNNETGEFIVCRLYDQSTQNDTYIDKDPYLITSVSDPLSVEEMLSHVKATDSYDLDVTDSITLVDTNYSVEDSYVSAGVYYMLVGAMDHSGNYTQQKIFIVAADYTAPVISGPSTVDVKYNVKKSVLSYGGTILEAIDDVDGKVTNFYIISDNYSSNWNILGQYSVVYGIKDKSGNESKYEVIYNVVDTFAPEIYAISSTSQDVTDGLLTKEDIISCFYYNDDYDKKNVTVTLDGYEEYAANFDKLGSFRMKITVTDKSGNSTFLEFDFAILDLEKPSIYIDGDITKIIVSKGTNVTQNDIINLIKQQNPNALSIVNVQSEYFNTEEPTGEYDLFVTFEDGSVQTYKISVNSTTPIDTVDNSRLITLSIALGVGLLIVVKTISDKRKRNKKSKA